MSVIGRGIRNAFRNVTRTVAIVLVLGLSIGLSFAMLIGHKSVQGKIDATLAAIGNVVNIAPPGYAAGGTNSRYLTTTQLSKVARLSHVVSLDETLPGAARLATGDQLSFVGANEPTNPVNVGASKLTITAGHAFDGTGDADDAMVSTATAKRDHLSVGSTFRAYGAVFTVSGIFDSDTANGNSTVLVPLATEQRLTHSGDEVANAIATTDSLANLSAVTAEIDFALGPGALVTSDVAQADQALAPLSSVKSLSLYSLIGAIAAAAVISFLLMVMIVRERKREVGILKAIGAPNPRITYQFMVEALTFGVLGGAAGLLAGALGASSITSSLVGNAKSSTAALAAQNPALAHVSNVNATASVPDVLIGLAGILLIAGFGSAAASYLITKIQPAEALRSE